MWWLGLLTAGFLHAAVGPELPAVNERQLLAETDQRIRAARTAPLTVTVVDSLGRTCTNVSVRVDHTNHLFFFGTSFDGNFLPKESESDVDARHREHFLRLCNYSTIRMYWGSYEPSQGDYQHTSRLRAVEWLGAHGITARGHPVFWNLDAIVPRWVKQRDPAPAEMRRLWDARLTQMAGTLLPQFHDADVFNELVHWERISNSLTRLLKEQGKPAVVTEYLKETKRRVPGLKTVVNDYEHGPAYYALLKQLLEAGAPIDIVGQQSHMHTGTWTATQLWNVLNRLALLYRPVLFTELSVLSGAGRKIDWSTTQPDWHSTPEHEARQAEYLERFYRLAYSHTNCIGIVLWDFSDRRAWLGAPVGVLRKDGSPKPAYMRLDHLVNKAWRTRGEFLTDANGRVELPAAFEGQYSIAAAGTRTNGTHGPKAPLEVTLRSE